MPDTQILLRHPQLPSAPTIKLCEGTTVLGRDPTCTIVLSDPSISRFHADFSIDGTVVTIRDLKSHNGTYVDGERIESSRVRAGQVLHFGCVPLRLETTGENCGQRAGDLETASVSDVFEAAPAALDALLLSVAERRVFDLLLPGLTEKEIAHRLGISRHTVHTHVRKIYDVLGVRSRAELSARFIRLPG